MNFVVWTYLPSILSHRYLVLFPQPIIPPTRCRNRNRFVTQILIEGHRARLLGGYVPDPLHRAKKYLFFIFEGMEANLWRGVPSASNKGRKQQVR